MFAVIKTGGKQYKVAANDVLKVEKVAGEPGDVVTFGEVLMVGNGDDVTVGAPLVQGAQVAGHVIETRKQKTIIVFKKERRHNYRRRNGHRQLLTTVRIAEILTGGAAVTTTADEKIKARHAALQQAASSVAEAPAAKQARTAAAVAAPAEAGGFVDDIKLIGGVGPTLEKKLHAAGVNSLRDIAAWTEADLAKYDEELALRGRATRDEWVQQAQDLIAGKPPRAKVDQELQASEEGDKPAKKPARARKAKADDESKTDDAPKADEE